MNNIKALIIDSDFNDYINSQIEDYCNNYISEFSYEQTNEKFIDLKEDYIYDNIKIIISYYKFLLLTQNISIDENSGSLHLISNFFSKNNYNVKNKYKNRSNEIACILISQIDKSLYDYHLEYLDNFIELNEEKLIIISDETEFYLNEPKGFGKKNYIIAKFNLL